MKPTIIFANEKKTTRLVDASQKTGARFVRDAVCGILAACGACPYLDLPYKDQLAKKQDDLSKRMNSFGDLFKDVKVTNCVESPDKLGYRHTAKLVVGEEPSSGSRRYIKIGLYQRDTHQILDIGQCPVQSDLVNSIASFLRLAIREFEVSTYHEIRKTGLLRYVIIRTSSDSKNALLTFVVTSNEVAKLKQLSRQLTEKFAQVRGVTIHLNTLAGNSVIDFATGADSIISGDGFITTKQGQMQIRCTATSFMQVNPKIAHRMYFRIAELADVKAGEIVLDLYSGTGTIALHLGQKGRVIGFEESVSAYMDALFNANQNKVPNATFVNGPVQDSLPKFLAQNSLVKADVISVNPPRSGCSREILDMIVGLNPRAILYMSCYSGSLLRDLEILAKQGYKTLFLEPFDMFPGTEHYETLAYVVKA